MVHSNRRGWPAFLLHPLIYVAILTASGSVQLYQSIQSAMSSSQLLARIRRGRSLFQSFLYFLHWLVVFDTANVLE